MNITKQGPQHYMYQILRHSCYGAGGISPFEGNQLSVQYVLLSLQYLHSRTRENWLFQSYVSMNLGMCYTSSCKEMQQCQFNILNMLIFSKERKTRSLQLFLAPYRLLLINHPFLYLLIF